jgi:hypothetical protein
LPTFIELNPYLNTPEDHLLPALEIDAELYNVAIVDWKGFGLGTG